LFAATFALLTTQACSPSPLGGKHLDRNESDSTGRKDSKKEKGEDGAERQPTSTKVAVFGTIYSVLVSPRCRNCHGTESGPLQGDDSHPHTMGVSRDTACSQCHASENTAEGPPGATGWRMPPSGMEFKDRTAAELCARLKDKAQNGGKTLDQLREHFEND